MRGDFVVIGSGSGLDVANAAANEGQSVAIVEKGQLGEIGLNRGCIPSKMLLYRADVLETIEQGSEFHIDAEITNVDFADIVREINEEVEADAELILKNRTVSLRFPARPTTHCASTVTSTLSPSTRTSGSRCGNGGNRPCLRSHWD